MPLRPSECSDAEGVGPLDQLLRGVPRVGKATIVELIMYGIAAATPVLTCPMGGASSSPLDAACTVKQRRDLVADKTTAHPTYPSGCLYADPAYPLPDECRSMLTALPTPAATLRANR
jgi:hypothetical protein